MADEPPHDSKTSRIATNVVPFVHHILGHMSIRRARDLQRADARLLANMRSALLSSCSVRRAAIVTDLLEAGVSLENIADVYVPEMARALGDSWDADEDGFATTSVGVARLQWLLHQLDEKLPAVQPAPDAPAVLVLVPALEDHTLGAVLLTHQLRRRGFSVRLMLNVQPEAVLLRLRGSEFDAAMVSTSLGGHLETLPGLVHYARRVMKKGARVVIGGAIVREPIDVPALTGADCAAHDLDAALRLCQLDPAALPLPPS